MNRVLDVVDSTYFWVAVFLAGLVFVFAYSYTSNRAEVARNAEALRGQEQALAYLCEQVRILDVLVVQTARVDELFLADKTLSPSVKRVIERRQRILATAHAELSDTRACRSVE